MSIIFPSKLESVIDLCEEVTDLSCTENLSKDIIVPDSHDKKHTHAKYRQ